MYMPIRTTSNPFPLNSTGSIYTNKGNSHLDYEAFAIDLFRAMGIRFFI